MYVQYGKVTTSLHHDKHNMTSHIIVIYILKQIITCHLAIIGKVFTVPYNNSNGTKYTLQ